MKVRTSNSNLILLNPLVLEKLRYQKHLTQKPPTELVVSLSVNHEEHLLRDLDDTGISISIILEAFDSEAFIKTDKSNTITWMAMDGKFNTNKTGICL
jgi:hypothetical protein